MLPNALLLRALAVSPALFTMQPRLAVVPCLPSEVDARATAPAPPPPAPLPPPPSLHRVPAALSVAEQARYRVTYGVFTVGEATVNVDGAETVADHTPLHARGHAAGSFVGFGQFDHSIDVSFDPVALVPVASPPGARKTDGRPLLWQRLMSRFQTSTLPTGPSVVTFDPVSLLLRLRADPPASGATLVATVFDGKARWRVTLTNRGPATAGGTTPALKVEGLAEPISNAQPPGKPPTAGQRKDPRVPRAFTLWLSADPTHLPLRMEMPVGMANLVVVLVEVRRTEAATAAK
jgi:hypothetical protein